MKALVVMGTVVLSRDSCVRYRAVCFLSLCPLVQQASCECHAVGGTGDMAEAPGSLCWPLADFTSIDSCLRLHWFLSCKRPHRAWQPRRICQGSGNERETPKHPGQAWGHSSLQKLPPEAIGSVFQACPIVLSDGRRRHTSALAGPA